MATEAHFVTYICNVTHEVDRFDSYRGDGFYGCVRETGRPGRWYGPFENEHSAVQFMTTADGRRPAVHGRD